MIVSAVVGVAAFIWSIWKNNYLVSKLTDKSSGNIGKIFRVIFITIA
jgi:hypothetical protein